MMKILKQENRIYKIKTPVIAITGGIATGKTSFCNILREKGYAVIDADQLVKKIYSSPAAIEFLKKIAPACICDNQINFKILRAWFFERKSNKRIIENYIYQNLQATFLKEYESVKDQKVIFYDIPLLFEKDLESFFDSDVCIYIPQEEQLNRLIKRDNITKELAETIISTQLDIELKKKRSSHIIDNLSTLEDLKDKALEFIKLIEEELVIHN